MPKRLALSAVAVALVFCLFTPDQRKTSAQTAASAADSPALRVISVNEQPTDVDFEPLRKRLDEVAFEDAPFDQCIAWLKSVVDANIMVRYRTLEDAGIERDKPVTFEARGLTAAQALRVILDEVGGPDMQLGYESYDGEVLVVSTREDLDREMLVRIYDISTLTQACDAHWNAVEVRRGSYSEDPGPRSIFGGARRLPATQPDRPDVQPPRRTQSENELLGLLRTTTRPDAWHLNGGDCTMECFGGLLVVRAPRSIHRELEGFLQTLNGMIAER